MTSPHYRNERLWNDVNQMDAVSDWNCTLDDEVIFHHHPHQSQKISITKNADEVITSFATDCMSLTFLVFQAMQGIHIQRLSKILLLRNSHS